MKVEIEGAVNSQSAQQRKGRERKRKRKYRDGRASREGARKKKEREGASLAVWY